MKMMEINGRIMKFPIVMGIININTDSFYDKSRALTEQEWLKKTEQYLLEGASIIDIGCASSRPGSSLISPNDEIEILKKVIPSISHHFPEAILSIDTYNSETAKKSIKWGAHLINDISAGELDPEMLPYILSSKTPFIAMHMRGTPENMHKKTNYENLLKEVYGYFLALSIKFGNEGHPHLIIDPGFGFAKTADQNFELMKHLNVFNQLNCPILVGVSRKSMIYKTLNTNTEKALNGTTVLNTIAIMKGADILRVHDVQPALEAIALWGKVK